MASDQASFQNSSVHWVAAASARAQEVHRRQEGPRHRLQDSPHLEDRLQQLPPPAEQLRMVLKPRQARMAARQPLHQ